MASPAPITRTSPAPTPPAICAEAATPQTQILTKLKELGQASPSEIRLHLRASRSTITRALRALESAGRVCATGETNNRLYTVAKSEVAS